MNTKAIFDYDKSFLPKMVAGMDEAGRGPLAGPVVAACVIMPLGDMIEGIDDSKKLSEKNREELYEKIVGNAVAYGVGIVNNDIIDRINILNATKEAMRTAYKNMKFVPSVLLVDAVKGLGLECECRSIIKGDATSYNIASASIIAKVTRDRIMREYSDKYPEYLFYKNKGYGTREHINALLKNGRCELHRKTFIGNFLPEFKTDSGNDKQLVFDMHE